MTFEQIFAGRMTLMRAQRHIAQAQVLHYEQGLLLKPIFRDHAGEQAFFAVEALLCELERDFDTKKKKRDARSRRRLDCRANRQVKEV